MKLKLGAAVMVIVVILAAMSAFVVDETEQVVVTRFQKVHHVYKAPGLKFKMPFIDKALYYPRNVQEWDGDPGEIPTSGKTYIWVDTFACWQIVDPVKFFTSIGSLNRAQSRLDEIIDSAVRNLITSNRLIEAVRDTNRSLSTLEIGLADVQKDVRSSYHITMGRSKMVQAIQDQASPKLVEFGIKLLNVRIKRINYVAEVRKSVYGRMIAERKQIAEKYRSEGQGEAHKILGDKERDLKQISSEAYKQAQEIKGTADAKATDIYAKAYGADPEFYQFMQTLDLYKKTLGKNSTLVLSTDSDLFKYIRNYKGKTGH